MTDGRIGLVVIKEASGDPKITVYRTSWTIRIVTPSLGATLSVEQARAVRRALSRYIREAQAEVEAQP